MPPKNTLLTCPVRGQLTASALAVDGLTETEESRRIDLLEFLIEQRKYPVENFDVETIVLKNIGNSGRNSLRADLLVYNIPAKDLHGKSIEEKLKHVSLIGEVKRDSSEKKKGVNLQLKPALQVIPKLDVLGVYWDDINRLIYVKSLENNSLLINELDIAKLPDWGYEVFNNAITYNKLTSPKNLLKTLNSIADTMRSEGIEDKKVRYTETVKLLLARYTDEKKAADSADGILSMQVFDESDSVFRKRIDKVYSDSARKYSNAKTLFSPNITSSLSNKTLRELVAKIQGFRLTDAKNETIQQIFMSFVPAVFKKELSQYFTPISLIETIVSMVDIKRNDKIVDPAMGTADFLALALAARAKDDDIHQRLFGIDRDTSAFELAVVNMILNKDGQTGLICEDSIENHQRWKNEMDVALCNPPFGSRTIQKDPDVLSHYQLGHEWEDVDGKLQPKGTIRKSQQLGILFIERCWKMLAVGGRLGIILPEGYLSGSGYKYVRKWILDNFKILALVELPRRIFVKSDADLRSNILILEKRDPSMPTANYRIYASMVRKVGYKLSGDFSLTPQKDPESGLSIHDENNQILLDSDFLRVLSEFNDFKNTNDRKWSGAHLNDVLNSPDLDLKPRRLVPRAVQLMHELSTNPKVVKLGDIAEVVDSTFYVGSNENKSKNFRAIEGNNIRAVEGLITPGFPERGWEIAERKQSSVYKVKPRDIVIGLVRPERRNVGIVISDDSNLVAIKDGVALVREKSAEYPAEWLFEVLRKEETRIQMWINSGGTSYGKLTLDQIKNILIEVDGQVITKSERVKAWVQAQHNVLKAWSQIGSEEDRKPILNSPLTGLIE